MSKQKKNPPCRGTAAEVRAASLLPYRRRMLADDLRVARYVCARHTEYNLREWAGRCRREAVGACAADARLRVSVDIPSSLDVLVDAAARAQGVSVGDFAEAALRAAVEKARPFTLTRHERAALERLGERWGMFETGATGAVVRDDR